MRLFAMLMILLFVSACTGRTDLPPAKKADEPQKETTYQREMEDLRKSIKSEVKIKLKKDGKGSYSWELQGKDPQEVLRVNDTLRKKLGD